MILDPGPVLDGGRYAPKRTAGETVDVRATIFADGHDVLRAVVKWKSPAGRRWNEAPLTHIDKHVDGDTFTGAFPVDELGRYEWTIEAWIDRFASWREEIRRKVEFGQHDLAGELSEGVLLLEAARDRAKAGSDRKLIRHALGVIADPDAPEEAKHDAALGPELAAAIDRYPDRADEAASLPEPYVVDVDSPLSRFSSWYELFPRSWGGFRGTAEVVPQIAALGFDVLYFPPIHPIGVKNRKGRNNALTAGPDDPGSVYAIGNQDEGGHEAVHPELGTLEDFGHLVRTANEHGLEIALDFAIQCSADHPWLTEHPEWFHRRPDGSLKYAENPPKKYQDIYNVNFQCEDWRNLWNALRDVVLLWVERGVKIFRVDNPHTKPLAFWEWMIAEVRAKHPDTVFLAEAFTRRAVMRALGKSGFNQSYTYFTWQQSRWELEQYVNELAYESSEYFRPNFFANTPDILTEQLQHGGRAAFESRLVLAATLSPSYGIYSGYEWIEHTAVRPGSEEYLDSEKYEIKQRTLEGAPLLGLVRLLNEARRAHPALQHLSNITFLDTRNDGLIAYIKKTGDDAILAVVCLDPQWAQEGSVVVPDNLGLPWNFQVQDLLDGSRYDWHVGDNYVRLAPGDRQAHLLRVVNG
ncbi:alpha-1,4-glucan--maltose-1-phosphate maltosyltransferase [Conexibacter woesei]|uniref:alpha-1,4-glucan--maltose-1-phosphate maltosyltransferase n=1 Tax=Conexibacter woesei TaxID=191495 RepID=UPI0006852518|nr:alpha-1,4-glucan--maltose-1-phosphate maltosyltransferase [Conexibacter woesei]